MAPEGTLHSEAHGVVADVAGEEVTISTMVSAAIAELLSDTIM